jgi:hypothetical protein
MPRETKNKRAHKTKNSSLPCIPVESSSNLQRRLGAPKFKLIKENTLGPKEKNFNKFKNQMRKTTGTEDIDFFATLITQVSNINTDAQNDQAKAANFSSAFLHGLEPRDQTEGTLFAQMAGTHNLIMEYMRRAIFPGQHLEAGEDYTNRACKLMNIFLRQIETLLKYRGKSTQQKVIVEHVHVEEGGKAIVGNVEQRTGGEGDDRTK